MKNTLFLALLAVAFLATACGDDPGASNSLTSPGNGLQKAPEMYLNLDAGQATLISEMTYLQEDMSILLNPSQLTTFNSLVTTLADDRRDPRRMAVDMEAVVWFNLIYKANPNLDPTVLAQIRQLIAESAARRAEILKSGASREEIAAQLKAEHDALMAAINAAAGREAVANAEKLKADIEARRKELQDKMVELRIAAEVARMKAALGLTDEQAAAVAIVLKYQHDKLKELREQYKDNPEGLRLALQELLADIDARMGGAITPELWERWKEIRSGRIKPVDPVDPIQKQVDELTKLLGLNNEQAAQLKELLTKQQAEINALMKDPTTDRRLLAEKIEQIKKQYDAMIIRQLGLTDAQIAQYNRWRGIRDIKPVDPVDPIQQQVDMLTKLLGLNPEQAAELAKILQSEKAQIDELMKNATDRNSLAEKIAEIKKATETAILGIAGLTEEQKALYLKWKTGSIRPRG
ncbi:MAG: hypothetical protein M5R41_08315 [Bacteroidia bacterium]|nr:hypothetical protein [Bacteroidia bacterium]